MTHRLIAAVALAASCVSPAFAGTVYTYSGPAYNFCAGSYGSGTCNSTYSLTGSFTTTLSLAQLENLSDFTIPTADISSLSFTDGFLATLNQSNAVTDVVEISTDGSGRITSWAIDLSTVTPEANSTVQGETIVTESQPTGPANADLSGNLVNTICGASVPASCGLSLTSGGDISMATEEGTWSAPQTVPEPGACLLLGTGLAAIAIRRRR